MPKIAYIERRFTPQWEAMIDTVNAVLEDYEEQGYLLTLRQLYYQLVAHDLFPDDRRFARRGGKWVRDDNGTKNADPNYDWLGSIVNDGRLAGLIDWEHLEDRTRNLRDITHFTNAKDALYKLVGWYRLDMWENQAVRVEVWIEKDALVGVIENVCQRLDVPFFSCRGYTSQSEMWRAGERLRYWHDQGYDTHIIHLGDHDPSGIDMSRDIFDRLELFMGGTEFERIALNMDQVQQYQPPPNPAKVSDSRCRAYVREYGEESWELDALEPTVINNLIETAILELRDQDQYTADRQRQQRTTDRLRALACEWDTNANRPIHELAVALAAAVGDRKARRANGLGLEDYIENWLLAGHRNR